jgi:hypothetical protein
LIEVSEELGAMPVAEMRVYDLFFSFRRHGLERAQALLAALEAAGLRVFRDETAIDEGASITQKNPGRHRRLNAARGILFQHLSLEQRLPRGNHFGLAGRPKRG